ncbi:follicle-stimulating hormone receptor [Sardina pilchardus]|uniref:follicle-stimulating hormone receptor n=1 Tax=Sardina pilchardus TaxID=27697 RepID=UPI002E0D4E9A
MAMKSVLPVVMLGLSLMGLGGAANSALAQSHHCEFRGTSLFCRNEMVEKVPENIPQNTTHITFKQTHISSLPKEAFSDLQHLNNILITENGNLQRIHDHSFANLPRLAEIIITKSKNLVIIYKDAFLNLPKLRHLSISNTGLKMLPVFSGINSRALNFVLDIQENMHIQVIPSNAFQGLSTDTITELRLTKNGITKVESYAFNGTNMGRLSLRGNQKLSLIHRDAFLGADGLNTLDISYTNVDALPEAILRTIKFLVATSVYSMRMLPRVELFANLTQVNLTYPSHCCAIANFRRNLTNISRSERPTFCDHPNLPKEEPVFYSHQCQNKTEIICYPKPDAFNPCESIMGHTYLRVLIWIICVLAIVGNTVVLLVLLTSRYKLTVPRFLMCHLAFAELCMGIYLMIIASVDIYTRADYFNFGIDWQMGMGCRAAGFFTVFASELSVYTLTVITLERWHTITYAMQLERKLRIRHAAALMAGGWAFAWLAALFPAVGIASSYMKVSICLPMDVESAASQAYVVLLLLLNVAAFIVVCACYLRIYVTVHNPRALAPLTSASDTRLAKRMAVLIFTDFLCMAPISFFAILAAFKWPLIDVPQAKVLLVLFYPINACANPFLYAFFTKTFKRDFFVLASRFGWFKMQAQIYRTESSSVQNGVWVPSPRTSETTIYSLVHMTHTY